MITDTTKTDPIAADGIETEWDFTFKVYSDEGITLIVTNENGVDSIIDEEDYTVDYDTGGENGGTVTYPLTGVLASGNYVSILRKVGLSQDVDYQRGQTFNGNLEDKFDRLTAIFSMIQEVLNRCLQSTITGSSSIDIEYVASLRDDATQGNSDISDIRYNSESDKDTNIAAWTIDESDAETDKDTVLSNQSSAISNSNKVWDHSVVFGSPYIITGNLQITAAMDSEREYIFPETLASDVTITFGALTSADDMRIFNFRFDGTKRGIIQPPSGFTIEGYAVDTGIEFFRAGYISFRVDYSNSKFLIVSTSDSHIEEVV